MTETEDLFGTGEEGEVVPLTPPGSPPASDGESAADSEYYFALDSTSAAWKSVLLLGRRTLECCMVEPEFAIPAAWALPHASGTLVVLPEKALRSTKSAEAGPLLAKAAFKAHIFSESLLLTSDLEEIMVDVGLFTSTIYDAIYPSVEQAPATPTPFAVETEGAGPRVVQLSAVSLVEKARLAITTSMEKPPPAKKAALGKTPSQASRAKPKAPLGTVAAFTPKATAPAALVAPRALRSSGEKVLPLVAQPAALPATGGVAPADAISSALRAALAAEGIPASELASIATILGNTRMAEPPRQGRYPQARAACEEEAADELIAVEEMVDERTDSLAVVMSRLTDVLSEMRGSRPSSSSLEQALGFTGSSSSEAGVTGGISRRNAGSRLALRKALTDSPQEFSDHIDNMVRGQVASLIRTDPTPANSTGNRGRLVPWRTYLEYRCYYNGHRPTMFWMWSISGVLELMSVGRFEEAYSRLALLIPAGEQLCLDGGNPTMSQELTFEDPAPIVQSRSPDSSASQWSRLLDDRWAEVVVGHLQNRWAMEKRKSEAIRRKSGPAEAPSGAGENENDAAPKGRPRRPKKKE